MAGFDDPDSTQMGQVTVFHDDDTRCDPLTQPPLQGLCHGGGSFTATDHVDVFTFGEIVTAVTDPKPLGFDPAAARHCALRRNGRQAGPKDRLCSCTHFLYVFICFLQCLLHYVTVVSTAIYRLWSNGNRPVPFIKPWEGTRIGKMSRTVKNIDLLVNLTSRTVISN